MRESGEPMECGIFVFIESSNKFTYNIGVTARVNFLQFHQKLYKVYLNPHYPMPPKEKVVRWKNPSGTTILKSK